MSTWNRTRGGSSGARSRSAAHTRPSQLAQEARHALGRATWPQRLPPGKSARTSSRYAPKVAQFARQVANGMHPPTARISQVSIAIIPTVRAENCTQARRV
jgi:hypothetical protein